MAVMACLASREIPDSEVNLSKAFSSLNPIQIENDKNVKLFTP
jgi:hypothetical protein